MTQTAESLDPRIAELAFGVRRSGGPVSRTRGCTLRLAPVREPRFDDERPDRHLSLVGRDALALPFAEPAPADEVATPLLVAQPAPPPSGLPEPVRFGRYYVQALLEVLSGRRPAAQLTQHTAPRVLAGLTHQQARDTRFDNGGRNPVVHSVHVMEPAERVAELTAVVQVGPRFRAIAARLEAHHGQWRCVRLQVG